MTVHLYYDNSYLSEFTAEIIEIRNDGGQKAVVLDRSAFYPTSGGQPSDRGILSNARVLGVEEDQTTGAILHLLDSDLPLGPVRGSIDWDRRFDHMQQHTGQHILSQAFLKVAQATTLSFHLGEEYCTIDVDLARPAPEIMEKTEDLANSIVFENRLVKVETVDRSELASLGVRKETPREGPIRVVEVEGFDRSACGGTHVRRSGEIGCIAVLGFERYKGGTRVTFACGRRALKVMRREHAALADLGSLFSAHRDEVHRLAAKLIEDRASLARENARLSDRLSEMEASELIQQSGKVKGRCLVQGRYSDRGIESLKTLAQKVVMQGNAVAILASVQETAQIVVAKSPDIPGSCGDAIRKASSSHGGKGGGRPDLAQAGGIPIGALDAWFIVLADQILGAS